MFKPCVNPSFQRSEDPVQRLRKLVFRDHLIEPALKLLCLVRQSRNLNVDGVDSGLEIFQIGALGHIAEHAQASQQSVSGANYDQYRLPGCSQGF